MKPSLFLPLSFLGLATSYGLDFQSPNYHVGDEVNGKQGWVSNGAIVSDEKAGISDQSLKLAASKTISREITGAGIVFYDLVILPEFPEAGGDPEITIGGALLGFSRSESGGSVLSFSKGNGEELEVTEVTGFPLEESTHISKGWIRITIRMDVGRGNWDLYLDGRPVLADTALIERGNTFKIEARHQVYLDSWNQSDENPLFPDADKDGIPDAEELALGLDPYVNDRAGDLDGDGISNAKEFFSGNTSWGSASGNWMGQDTPILFVDNSVGSDSNSGRYSSNHMGGDGPKASIKAAMVAAPQRAVIAILKGTGAYHEDYLGIEGKDITIKTIEPIRIK